MISHYKRFVFTLFFLTQVLTIVLASCNPAPRIQTAVAENTPTAAVTMLIPSDTPIPTSTPSVVPPTETATIQSTVDPSQQWCDNFDDGNVDQSRWNLPTDSALIYEQNGVLNFRVIEDQSRDEEAWAGLEAKQTDQLISEVYYTITLESYGENTPGGVGLDIFLQEEDPVFSFDVGPGPNGPGAEFSFCPNFNAGYEECAHPTPAPDKASFRVAVGTPMQVRVVGTDTNVEFNIDDQPRAGQPATAPIENFQFFIYADPGSTLHATIDNACVIYK